MPATRAETFSGTVSRDLFFESICLTQAFMKPGSTPSAALNSKCTLLIWMCGRLADVKRPNTHVPGTKPSSVPMPSGYAEPMGVIPLM